MKSEYTDLTTALADREGVAVLGFFYEVLIFDPVLLNLTVRQATIKNEN